MVTEFHFVKKLTGYKRLYKLIECEVVSKIKNIRHIGIVVKNMDVALKFYRDLLGLEIQGKTEEYGNFIDKILKISDTKLKTIKLSAEDNATRIELLKFETPISKEDSTKSLGRNGLTHLSLTVKNLDELYLLLKNEGIFFNSEPQISPDKSLKVVFCKDFEGNFLELTQEL